MIFLKKLLFLFKRPQVVIIIGNGRSYVSKTILHILKSFPKKKKILVLESDLLNQNEYKIFNFYLRRSKKPILIVTHLGEIYPDRILVADEEEKTIGARKLARTLPNYGYLILNSDDEAFQEIKKETKANVLSYGFWEKADFKASDINIDLEGTNFKINVEGNIIPFWLRGLFGKAHIYSILASVALAKINGINLVDFSQIFNEYESLSGKMKRIKGIKKSLIIDNSRSATLSSTIEALDILGKIKGVKGRKIAVLGDIFGIKEYIIEAHGTIGREASKNSDILITIGLRAKFIAQGAKIEGMPEDNIFQFEDANEAKKRIQEIIKEGDLILVNGSKEMKMSEVIEEIKGYF